MQNLMANRKKQIRKSRLVFILICTVPCLLLYVILKLVPLFTMFIQSFQKFNSMFGDKTWVGFSNFSAIFRDSVFGRSLLMTLFYVVAATAATIILALLLATLLAKSKAKGKTFFRVVFYIPNILSLVIIGGFFQALFKGNGIFNSVFGSNIDWMGTNTGHWTILFAMIWQAVGYYMVMYIAGMDSIPDSLYESARLDGASPVRQFFQITIPMLWEVIRTTLTFFIISNINLAFLFSIIITPGFTHMPADTTLNYMQRKMNGSFEYGIAMAAGTVIFLLTFLASLLVQKLTKREVIEAQ